MTRITIATITVLALSGCVQTTASYDGETVNFSTQRLFKDDSLDSATLGIDPETKTATLELKGKRSETSEAFTATMGTIGNITKMLLDENSKLHDRIATQPENPDLFGGDAEGDVTPDEGEAE